MVFAFEKLLLNVGLSVNGIFNDVRYDSFVHRSIRMICAKNYETVSKFVRVKACFHYGCALHCVASDSQLPRASKRFNAQR